MMEDSMIRRLIAIAVLLNIFVLSACSQASENDVSKVLAKAQKDGKVVMLELGSVGCIPCEQMKPVMQKLRETYKDKLEVLFVDVRVDRPTAVRFGVTVIPTQVFLDKNGKEFHRHVGFYDYWDIFDVLKAQGL
jgi:thioredoxin 1